MTITTLKYIHDLLQETVKTASDNFDYCKKQLNKAKEKAKVEKDSPQDVKDKEMMMNFFQEQLSNAQKALGDFEAHNWR